MMHIENIFMDFNDFLIRNKYVIVDEQQKCVIMSPYMTSLKEKFNEIIYNYIHDIGFNKLSIPNFAHEDFFWSKLTWPQKYESLKEPAIIYCGGKRLHKAYIMSTKTDAYSTLIFKTLVQSHVDLPLKYFSINTAFNQCYFSDTLQKSSESIFFDMYWFDNELDTTEMINIINTYVISPIVKLLKIDVEIVKNVDGGLVFTDNFGDRVELCKYRVYTKDDTKQMNISYTSESGCVQHPFFINYQINETILWCFILTHFDKIGFKLPIMFIPFDVAIIPIYDNIHNVHIDTYLKSVEDYLVSNNIRFYVDNTFESIGAKHYKWEKLGIPIQIEVGYNEYSNNNISVINRYTGKRSKTGLAGILSEMTFFKNYWE